MDASDTYATPFDDLFRSLTPAERRELTASITEHGVRVPVTVYTSANHGPAIIDGGNRWSICQELGIDCPVNDLGEMKDAEARELAEQLNHCRRHLSPKDWQGMAAKRANRIKRVVEKRKEGKSLRVIAEEEGVDKKTIQKDLEEAGGGPSPPEPESEQPSPPPAPPTVTGRDGKTYTATKPKPVSPPPPAPQQQPRPLPPTPQPRPMPTPPPPAPDNTALFRAFSEDMAGTIARLSTLSVEPAAAGRIDWARARRLLDELNALLTGS